MNDQLARLHAVLDTAATWSFAVSGGVDSMTLATLAHWHLPQKPRMVHATSPAVPAAARSLIEAHAKAEAWQLDIIDAGEFADPEYRANPVNRCYFCKSNLYDSVRAVLAVSQGTVASGTNLDDLGDFRPGLKSAEERGIRHPLVEAGIDKAAVRALARDNRLGFAELPAQPCLASRVETGLRIEPADMAFIDQLETEIRGATSSEFDLRVRVRRAGIAVETSGNPAGWDKIAVVAASACARTDRNFLGVQPYLQGSAFLRENK
jgi:uncharacterized protein